jgi:hypothetical protein
MTAEGISMYDFGEILLAHTTLTGDEHTEVGGCDLHSHLYAAIEQRAIAYDTKSLLNGL